MTTELAIRPDQSGFDDKQLAALRALGISNAPAADVAILFHQAARTGLDPFARQIYLIGRGGKWNIQTGIDGFRVIRDRKGTYRGHTEEWCGPDGQWRDVWLEEKNPAAARVSVYVDGYQVPVVGVARWSEYAQDSSPTWKRMPALMLAKCAEALALRKAYPQDLSGLYTDDEIPQEPASGPVHVRAARQTAKVVEDPARWLPALNNSQTVGELRAVWEEVQMTGELDAEIEGRTLRDMITGRKTLLEQDEAAERAPQAARAAIRDPEPPSA